MGAARRHLAATQRALVRLSTCAARSVRRGCRGQEEDSRHGGSQMLSQPRRRPAFTCVLLLGLVVLAACSQFDANGKSLPTPTVGAIVITLDRGGYTSSQPIGVNVNNASKQNVYALDGRSGCTFLQLEIFNAD